MAAMFSKFQEVQWYTWLIVAALVALFGMLTVASKRVEWNSRRIAYASMVIAISFVLSYIRLFRMPQGGSVTLVSMLPIIAFSLAAGPVQGLMVGCAYGLLQLVQGMSNVIHPVQLLLDYPLGFGALALGGLAMFIPVKKQWKLPLAIVIGCAGRLLMSTISGAVFFAEYAEGSGHTPVIYSLLYNGSYIGAEAVLSVALALVPGVNRIVDVLKEGQIK